MFYANIFTRLKRRGVFLMEEINIKEFLGFIKDKVLYVIIAIVLCVAGFAIYDTCIKIPKYSTYSTIALVRSNNDATMTQILMLIMEWLLLILS